METAQNPKYNYSLSKAETNLNPQKDKPNPT